MDFLVKAQKSIRPIPSLKSSEKDRLITIIPTKFERNEDQEEENIMYKDYLEKQSICLGFNSLLRKCHSAISKFEYEGLPIKTYAQIFNVKPFPEMLESMKMIHRDNLKYHLAIEDILFYNKYPKEKLYIAKQEIQFEDVLEQGWEQYYLQIGHVDNVTLSDKYTINELLMFLTQLAMMLSRPFSLYIGLSKEQLAGVIFDMTKELKLDHRLVLGPTRLWKVHSTIGPAINFCDNPSIDSLSSPLDQLGFKLNRLGYNAKEMYLEYVYYSLADKFEIKEKKIVYNKQVYELKYLIELIREHPKSALLKFGFVQLQRLINLCKDDVLTFAFENMKIPKRELFSTLNADAMMNMLNLAIMLYNWDESFSQNWIDAWVKEPSDLHPDQTGSTKEKIFKGLIISLKFLKMDSNFANLEVIKMIESEPNLYVKSSETIQSYLENMVKINELSIFRVLPRMGRNLLITLYYYRAKIQLLDNDMMTFNIEL